MALKLTPNDFEGIQLVRLIQHLVEQDPADPQLLVMRTNGIVQVAPPVVTVGGGATRHAYFEGNATGAGITINCVDVNTAAAFQGLEIIVANDGTAPGEDVHVNFNVAAAVGTHHKLLPGEAFNFGLSESNGAPITDVRLITPGPNVPVRVTIFGQPPAGP